MFSKQSLKKKDRPVTMVYHPEKLPEGKMVGYLWTQELLRRDSSRKISRILKTSALEDQLFEALESGQLKDKDGNDIRSIAGFEPIKHARSGQTELFVYRAYLEPFPGAEKKQWEPVVVKFWTGEPEGQGKVTKDIVFYEAASKVDLHDPETGEEQGTLRDWTPFQCEIPAENMPEGCGSVVVMKDWGDSLYDILIQDNPEERKAAGRLFWRELDRQTYLLSKKPSAIRKPESSGYGFKNALEGLADPSHAHLLVGELGSTAKKSIWARMRRTREEVVHIMKNPGGSRKMVGELVLDPVGELYDPDTAWKTLAGPARSALAVLMPHEQVQAHILKIFGGDLKALATFFKKHNPGLWCRDDLALTIENMDAGDGKLPPLLERMAKDFIRSGRAAKNTKLPMTMGQIGNLALKMAIELHGRETKHQALVTLRREYIKLVKSQMKLDPVAHRKSVSRLHGQGLEALKGIDELLVTLTRPMREKSSIDRVALNRAYPIYSIRRRFRPEILDAIRKMKRIKATLPLICSDYASFCAYDFHWGNVLMLDKGTQKKVGHGIGIIDQAREWPANDRNPLMGSSILPLSFLQVRRHQSIPKQDRPYCEEALRKMTDEVGKLQGLLPVQINCQRRIAKAEACLYDVWRMLQGVERGEKIDLDKLELALERGLQEIEKYPNIIVIQLKLQLEGAELDKTTRVY